MPDSDVIVTDGSLCWSGGVDSISVTTVASDRNPGGIARDKVCWGNNVTFRDGGITPRAGWQPICDIHPGDSLFQGKFVYSPLNADPYEIHSIGGHIYAVFPVTGLVVDLTAAFPANVPQFNPPDAPYAYFAQGERFLIIQAGDGVTLPFFWDGVTLRRSIGINSTAIPPGTPGVNEIPAATAMDYFMGRIWYAQDRQVNAGDIVRGPSGTAPYDRTDSILNVTENPMVLQGDGFTVPSADGTLIRAIKHSANIDAALGQGRLFVSTRKAIYALNVPVTRNDWIAANNNNQPLMTVVQLGNGWVNDRSVVAVNGDLFGQSLEPGIRSLNQSTRFFGQWGNIPISANEQRILQFNDRALLRFSTGIYFDNRLLQSALPVQTPQGVVHNALIPLDFVPISSFAQQKQPNWEGMYEGLKILQLSVGDYGGRERAFATVVNEAGKIALWELTSGDKFDNGDSRIVSIIEFPAFTWGDELGLKRIVGAELWIDRLFGKVQFVLQYRPDGQACWINWVAWTKCSTKNNPEDVNTPIAYPLTPCLESYFATMTMPKPPANCATATGRPSDICYQCQPRLVIKGFARVRGMYLHATKYGRKLYENMVCVDSET